ncbi:MAG: DUF4260 domain-containing protein [Anaerolineales bacterium]|nr:DUF4260 domain-containing protein [Anaerolineales bacterium]
MFTPKMLLHLEGAVLLIAAVTLYAQSGGSWWLFALLLFAPDISMVGYLVNQKIGAQTYNAIHIYLLPALLAAYGLFAATPLASQLALIWFAHIGMDRMLGYGLKYETAFKDTHLQRV